MVDDTPDVSVRYDGDSWTRMPITDDDIKFVRRLAWDFVKGRTDVFEAAFSDASLSLHQAVERWDDDDALRRDWLDRRNLYIKNVVQKDMIDGVRSRRGRGDETKPGQGVWEDSHLRIDGSGNGKEIHGRDDPNIVEFGAGEEDVLGQFTTLTEREREVIRLTTLHRRSVREIGQMFGVSEARIYTIKNRAIDKMVVELCGDPDSVQATTRLRNVLSKRERTVLECAATGAGVSDTAAKLYVSQETVKSHRKRILVKLHAANMTHAVALAFRYGILDAT